jgi:hypothetical protein
MEFLTDHKNQEIVLKESRRPARFSSKIPRNRFDRLELAGQMVEKEMWAAGYPRAPASTRGIYDTEAIWGLTLQELNDAVKILSSMLEKIPFWKRSKRQEVCWLLDLAAQRDAQAYGLVMLWS